MQVFDPDILKTLYKPPSGSHKGQNGKLMIIGGSHLFHGASLWALKVASRIVDMVFYSSVPENNQIVQKAKQEFRDGIIVPRNQLDDYMQEADGVLIGPGMVRSEFRVQNSEFRIENLEEINQIQDEGEQTYWLTKYLLEKYPHKRWVIDAGALQMMEPSWLRGICGHAILTPHPKEFESLFKKEPSLDEVSSTSRQYDIVLLVKGHSDVVCNKDVCISVAGGNAGMTKGGTGDVLAGLVAALYTKNDAFLSAQAASYINKKAGESLYERVGLYFNASDLVDEIPKVMKELLV